MMMTLPLPMVASPSVAAPSLSSIYPPGQGMMSAASPLPLPLPVPAPLHVLSGAFAAFVDTTIHDVGYEVCKKRLAELEEVLQSHGISGSNSISVLAQLKSHINWEGMVPDQFIRFYRFMFHTCKEPRKKHVQVDVALEAWQLVLAGRFRLLDRWCEFIRGRRSEFRVISEDQWRQVFDFSRTVHEDLSNFDPNGAWVWLLDEFVENLRKQRPPAHKTQQYMDCDSYAPEAMDPECSTSRVSPCCGRARTTDVIQVSRQGLAHQNLLRASISCLPEDLLSKRRSPDIDVVAEQLSAMPLSTRSSSGSLDHALKKHCGEGLTIGVGRLPLPALMSSPPDLEMPGELIHNLPAVQTSGRRTVRTRRSGGVSDLVNSVVSDSLGFPTL